MHMKFDSRGMDSVSIVLLTHKMTATFNSSFGNSKESSVTPEEICGAVLCIGFGCRLLRMSESEATRCSFGQP